MANISEKVFIFCILVAVLPNYAKAASVSPQECFTKYGSPLTQPSELDILMSVKFTCAKICQDTIFKQTRLNEAHERGYSGAESILNAMCRPAEKNDQNDRALDQCISKYGASKKVPLHGDSGEKEGCAVRCAYPDMLKALLEQQGQSVDDLDTECKGLEITRTNKQ